MNIPRSSPIATLLLALLGFTLTACSSTAVSPQTTATEHSERVAPTRPFPESSFLDLLVAEVAMRQHRLDTALHHYAIQARQTGDLEVIRTAAKLARHLNQNQQTAELARLWLDKSADDSEAHFILAMALSRLRQPLAALKHMDRVRALGDNSNFAALAASALALNQQDKAQFQSKLEQLAEQHPEDSSLKIARALLLQYSQHEDQALLLAREVLASEPSNPHALLIETRTLLQQGRNTEALERLKYAVDNNPGNKRLRHDLARALIKEEELYQAKAHYEVLIRQHANDSDILLELMLINKELNQGDEVAEQLKTLSRNPQQSSRAHYILGRLAEEERSWPEAIDHYQRVSGSEFTEASRRLTAISLSTEGAEQSLQRLRDLRQQYPQHAVSLYLLSSEILRKSQQHQAGFDLLSAALDKHPADTQLRYARSLFAERLGDLKAVEADLSAILEREPDNATALNALGYTLANLTSRLDEAEQLVRRALTLEPDEAAIIDSLGWILLLKGDTEAARTLLKKAFEIIQDHEIAAHYGEALWLLNEQDKAREVWKKGLQDTPNSPIIMETLERLRVLDD